jgi:hypothetical protein
MRHAVRIPLWGFLLLILLVPSSWPSHNVGEPKLEALPIWKNCCAKQDCVPQEVRIVGKEGKERVLIEIEGIRTKVVKGKLFPVPSPHTWVCYANPNGPISNENIRCILFPEQRGAV